jgi:hypothetical protein
MMRHWTWRVARAGIALSAMRKYAASCSIPYASVAHGDSCGNRGSPSHERIEDYALTHRERGANDLTHEGLRLERGCGAMSRSLG